VRALGGMDTDVFRVHVQGIWCLIVGVCVHLDLLDTIVLQVLCILLYLPQCICIVFKWNCVFLIPHRYRARQVLPWT